MKVKISIMNKSVDDNSHFEFVNSSQLILWLFVCQNEKLKNRKRNNCVVHVCQCSMSEIFGRSKTIRPRINWSFGLLICCGGLGLCGWGF